MFLNKIKGNTCKSHEFLLFYIYFSWLQFSESKFIRLRSIIIIVTLEELRAKYVSGLTSNKIYQIILKIIRISVYVRHTKLTCHDFISIHETLRH